ncbi:hypothetical protein FNV43_RR06656 [Rhamnella rubrinervis]|uniref:Uncharacterized protein n=1 Tax=Rhamnella rubrinervis TaxID=2594499 RepID=A0A8K0HDG2_9ROSA|nr:hypothetical protein FNV43_RR06656 [Rhamnella rubrinervis]
MEEEENMLPPFWLQTNDTLQRVENRRRRPFLRRSSSLFFNSGALILFLLVIALVFILIVIPSILSFTSHVFRPQSVKKSWDSLNLVLVLFAIVCGFLSRNSSENTGPYEDHQNVSNGSVLEARKSNPSTPRQWYDQYSDRTSYNRLRSSSSYPDLRQESSWVSRDDRWRSYDDTHVTSYRPVSSSLDLLHHRQAWQQEPEPGLDRDAFVVRTEESSPLPAPPSESSPPEPPPPSSPPRSTTPPEGVKRKAKRTHQALEVQNERTTESSERSDYEAVENYHPTPSTTPPPSPPSLPPPPLSAYQEIEQKSGKSEKKRMVVSKEFLLTSLRRKKKKQRQKSVENFEAILSNFSSSSSLPSQPPPSHAPPPPPPPPPPSVFHNLFSSKKGKTKKVQYPISQPQPPNPPPPPPPPRRPTSTVINSSKTKASRSITAHQLPSPATDDNVNRGNESPLIPIPPPPPPPPFKMPEWKFVRHGDFVRIKSDNSSRSGSPDLDESEDSGSKETSPMARSGDVTGMEGGESPAHMFCSSPDVNTKADTFIARFRAGLRLEKVNSAKERKSTLGPQPNPALDQYEE